MDFVEKARAGGGPSLLECKTYRIRGHGEGDPQAYRTREDVKKYKAKDPALRYQKKLKDSGILNDELIQEIDREYTKEMEEAEKLADQAPFPNTEDALLGLYK
jgi:TPP-dependent pyruvate/acetoin dehydrogenase alpha subunit